MFFSFSSASAAMMKMMVTVGQVWLLVFSDWVMDDDTGSVCESSAVSGWTEIEWCADVPVVIIS